MRSQLRDYVVFCSTERRQRVQFLYVCVSIKGSIMAKMTKNQLIDAIAEGTQASKGHKKAVIEQMATVG
jgi:hypothetical protein